LTASGSLQPKLLGRQSRHRRSHRQRSDLGANQARQAIEAANRAFPAWSKKTAKERAIILRKWFDLLLANQEDLARLMTLEQGKPITESRGEVAYAAAFIEWFAEEGKRIYGDTIPQHQADKRIVVINSRSASWPRSLHGIFARNDRRKAGPALASGCTLVIKPAEQTPLSASRLRFSASAPAFRKASST